MKRLILVLLVALVLPGRASAGGPTMLIGATEDAVRQPTLIGVKAQMDLLRLAGFNAVRVTQVWAPGKTKPDADDIRVLTNIVDAAKLDGVTVMATVTNFGNRTTPLTLEARDEFAAYTAALARALPSIRYFVIGNEPNINRYWLPQFNPDGSDAAAPAYEALLAEAYDALKAVSPKIMVLGGAISPRGGDDPDSIRPTHSPTTFIADMGEAYRAGDRLRPIMDGLAFHPYEDNSSVAPGDGRSRSTTPSSASSRRSRRPRQGSTPASSRRRSNRCRRTSRAATTGRRSSSRSASRPSARSRSSTRSTSPTSIAGNPVSSTSTRSRSRACSSSGEPPRRRGAESWRPARA